ncbi:hypothetical protein [Paenibacillus montanisoli]|uniref:Alpha-galactosidase n=1 Tax=Paenibacillus montanisoli TaxID=2081970 RepID=A0A328TZT8_9BACL|nr:hypothetical protein [Paenibacillus montanisoli]RAP75033.1 hypothetical protein DL346_16710 [Paenibacillus montanisoli]
MGITIENNKIKLMNEYILREFDISSGPVSTAYKIRPHGLSRGDAWIPVFSFEPWLPFEAAVTVNGIDYEAGPHKQTKDWDREGAFDVTRVEQGKGVYGDVLKLYCRGRNDQVPGLELMIEYEIADRLPLLSKSVRVSNISGEAIVVDNVCVDIARLFEGKLELAVFSDYYWDIRRDDPYYFSFTRFEFPEKIGMELKPGESFETFKCYEAVTSGDRDEASIILHRIYKELAPWIAKPLIKHIVNSCTAYEELLEVADRASEDGIEAVELFVGQLFTNTGDYIPRPDLFPNGWEDMKRMVDYYHAKNIAVLPYCSTTIAWPDSEVFIQHADWQYLGPEGIRYNPWGLGNMCYQSPWGEYIEGKLLHLLDDIGFDGLGLDGPYHRLPCLADDHKHPNSHCVEYMNWLWEKSFFGEITKRNKIITVPQEMQSMFLGAHQRPGGYREEDQNAMGGMPLVVTTRAYTFDSRYKDPACATWTSCNLEEYHGHSIEPSETNPATYDHAFGGVFGYGHCGALYGKHLYYGDVTRAIFRKWVAFFKKYRRTLAGEMVHLARPNGFEPDAVMHVSPNAEIPAVLVVFNPVDEEKQIALELPLKYAGFTGGSLVNIERVGSIQLDSRGHGIVRLNLQPFEILTLAVESDRPTASA